MQGRFLARISPKLGRLKSPQKLHLIQLLLFFSSLKIDQVNKHLDQVAQGNVEHKREDVKKALQLLLRNTSALEQVLTIVKSHVVYTILLNNY